MLQTTQGVAELTKLTGLQDQNPFLLFIAVIVSTSGCQA